MTHSISSKPRKPLPSMDEADTNCVNQLLDKYRQTAVFKRWLYCESNSEKSDKQRLVVITLTRVFVIKRGPMRRRQVRRAYPIVELKEVKVSYSYHGGELKRIKLAFHSHEDPLRIVATDEVTHDIVKAVVQSSRIVTHGHPEHRHPVLDIPEEFLIGAEKPDISNAEGVLRGYEVGCDFLEILPKFEITKNLKKLVAGDQTAIPFVMNKIFQEGGTIEPVHIQALCLSVQYSELFNEIDAAHCPLGDDGLASLAIAVSRNPHIQSVDVSHCKSGWSGVFRLAKNLKTCSEIPLKKLIMSKNKMGDAGMEELAGLLAERPIEVLGVSQCSIHSKGFKALAESACQNAWLNSLQQLDISGNNAGKSGSRALARYLRNAKCLKTLTATRSHLDCEILLEALYTNEELWRDGLTSINLSGNKLGTSHAACENLSNILAETNVLSTVAMAHVKFNALTFRTMMNGVFTNASDELKFALDLRGNDLKSACGEVLSDLARAVAQADQMRGGRMLAEIRREEGMTDPVIENIKTLILSNNNFDHEGMVSACEGLRYMSGLQNLVLDRNVPTKSDPHGKVRAGEAIANMLHRLPNLRMLSVNGASADGITESFSLGAAVRPILEEMATNASLTRLDISNNKLQNEGVAVLKKALLVNDESALSILNVSDNRIGEDGVRGLVEIARTTPSLTTLKVVGDPSKPLTPELKSALDELDDALSDNKKYAERSGAKSPSLMLRSPTILLGFRSQTFGQGPKADLQAPSMSFVPSNQGSPSGPQSPRARLNYASGGDSDSDEHADEVKTAETPTSAPRQQEAAVAEPADEQKEDGGGADAAAARAKSLSSMRDPTSSRLAPKLSVPF